MRLDAPSASEQDRSGNAVLAVHCFRTGRAEGFDFLNCPSSGVCVCLEQGRAGVLFSLCPSGRLGFRTVRVWLLFSHRPVPCFVFAPAGPEYCFRTARAGFVFVFVFAQAWGALPTCSGSLNSSPNADSNRQAGCRPDWADHRSIGTGGAVAHCRWKVYSTPPPRVPACTRPPAAPRCRRNSPERTRGSQRRSP